MDRCCARASSTAGTGGLSVLAALLLAGLVARDIAHRRRVEQDDGGSPAPGDRRPHDRAAWRTTSTISSR
ncbi:MAG: hypothetical protein WDO24_22385 [Pseudomonadota bacterium]